MAKSSPPNIEKMIAEGRGQGRGKDYKPFLDNYNTHSRGRTYRIESIKTGRKVHLFSELEAQAFDIYDFSPKVIDIRDQFPLLPLSETLEIAKTCGINHPRYPGTEQFSVLTTDLIVTINQDGKELDVARTCKYMVDIDARVMEKFEIERRYWLKRGVDWGVITEQEISPILLSNARHLRDYVEPASVDIPDELQPLVANELTERLRNEKHPLNYVALQCDERLGLERGSSLALTWHLIASGQWVVDLTKPLHAWEPSSIEFPAIN